MTAPKLPEGLEPVAWITERNLRHLLESTRISIPVFPDKASESEVALVLLSVAQAALQAQAAEKDAAIAALKEDAARHRFARLGSMTALVIEANGEIRNAGHRYRPHELAMEWAEKIDAAIDSALALAAKEAK